MPILKTKYSETIVNHNDEIVLVIPCRIRKTMHHEDTAPTGAKGSVLGLITKTNQTTTISTEAETFRTSVTWTREQTLKTVRCGNPRKAIPTRSSPTGTTSVKFAAQDVPLDPQWLGIWLGDGSSSACKITTDDKEILEYIDDR
jgi:hypothetical protein